MKLFPAFLLFLVLLPGIAKAGDESWINEGLQENEGGVYTLPAGTHTIEDQIIVPEGTTFQGDVGENGELLSKIFLADNSNFGHQVPLVALGSNTKVLYLDFDGNSENQDNVPVKKGKRTGNGYHNFIGAQNEKNIEVAYNNFFNNNGDGFRINRCKNVSFHDNTASKGGHDVFYQLRSEGIEAYNNTIYTRVNSALRAMDCSHLRWYNNVIITDGKKGNGLAMQIQHDGEPMEDLEVCNNVIISSYGPGLWLVGKTSGGEELWLHHNLFLNCGYNPDIYWVSGIVASGYDNARIENNVFDGSYLSAVTFWDYSKGSWSSEATAYLNANIFTDSQKGIQSGKGGFGVNNEISKQTVISSNNCYWGNDADTKGCSVSDTDIFIDPKVYNTPSGWTWTGSEWECDSVKPSEIGKIENIYDNTTDPTDEELEEFEFNNILDFLEMDFSDTANTTNTKVKPDIKWEEKGKSRAWVDIVGWDNLIERNGVFYIPEGQQPIVKYDAENTASRPVSLDTDLTLTEDNRTLTADLKVKAVYEVAKKKTKKVNGISVPSIELIRKSSTSHYYDTELIPETYRASINSTAYVTILNNSLSSQTRVYVPYSPDVMKILYEVNGTQTWHYLHTGTLNSTEKGIKYAQISELDYWTGENVSRLGNTLELSGAVDPDELTIVQYDIYGREIPITDYEIEVKNQDEKNLIPPITFLFSGIVGIFLIATYKVFEVFL